MKKDYTHITIILDRSGSMDSIREDTIGGFNAFLSKQKEGPGTVTLTFIQFDTQDAHEVIHKFKPIAEIPPLTRDVYVPRASTPLLDALGWSLNDLEKTIADMAEDQKPEQVIVVVITDGQENSSKEFKKAQITKIIRDKQDKAKWQFVFLSADLDAINDAVNAGVQVCSSLAFDKSAPGTRQAWESMSSSVSRSRSSKVQATFTNEDRKQQQSEQNRKLPPENQNNQ